MAKLLAVSKMTDEDKYVKIYINVDNVNYFSPALNPLYGEVHFMNGEIIQTLESVDYYKNASIFFKMKLELEVMT